MDDDSLSTHDFQSLFGASSDYDYGSRPPSPRNESMDDQPDDPMPEQDEPDALMFDEPHELLYDDIIYDDDGFAINFAPVVSLTLSDFVAMAMHIQTQAMPEFAEFLLTGIYAGVQYQVDPIKDALEDDHQVLALRDFDSVLGFHKDVCVNSFLAVYLVSKFSDTLSRNIHLKYSFSNQSGDHDDIPVHHIPNLCIGKWGTHNLLRAFFPGLYNRQSKSPFLDTEHMTTFYEKGLRPAIESLVPISTTEWPTTYTAEMIRARGKDGKLSFQTKTLGAWHVASLGDRIREALRLNNVPWGEGLVFLHQIRGVKSSSGHAPTPEAAHESLEEFLEEQRITDRCRAEGQWWIDVGLEIASEDGKCLAWRTDSHSHIVEQVLGISTNHAKRITKPGSSKYLRDPTSHLTAVSGCRISPGLRAQGPHQAAYLQMYTTDKALTYRPEGAHFGKFLTGQDILKNKADDFCRDLYKIYSDAAMENYSLARVEVRVPLSEARNVLVDININTIRNGLIAVDSPVWWSLRAYRLLAFKYVLEQQALGDPEFRANDSALLLTAAAPWFINGLHSTPDNGPASRDLMGKILPLINRTDADDETLLYPASTRIRRSAVEQEEEEVEEDELEEEGERLTDHVPEDNMSVASDLSDADAPVPEHQQDRRTNRQETLPYVPYGMVFLRPIRIGEGVTMPRFSDAEVPMVTWKTFKYIFGIHRERLDSEFFKTKVVASVHPYRVANRVRNTVAHAPVHPVPNIFNLAERGYALVPPVVDTGSDVEDQQNEIRMRRGDNDDNIDAKLTSLWNQFLVDLSLKAPNRKSASEISYCVLTSEERANVTEDTYKNLHLSAYFNDCQYRIGTKELWDSAFDKYWPLIPVVVRGAQNLPSMRYFISWGMLVQQLKSADAEDTIDEMRNVLRARFYTLGWIPHIDSGRVWYTKRDKKLYKKFPGTDPDKAAPRVLIRRNGQPTW